MDNIRSKFPSLNREHNGIPMVYMDGPGGTQVPDSVIEAVSSYYKNSNTNVHGFFPTSEETDQVISNARESMSDFLGAVSPNTISFGQNMTTLNYSLARAIGRSLEPGDEILITQLDHEANRGPWLSLIEFGMIVREVAIKPDGSLDYDDFEKKLNENTRVVAVGCASNAFGTVNDISWVRKQSYKYGALLVLDAVHYAPHFKIDVQEIGCDFLFCSAYKFYGPHVGILYSKPGVLDRLPTDCLRTQDQRAPYKIETGTLNHAALAGVSAAVDFIASMGEGVSRKQKISSAMKTIAAHEHDLALQLFNGFNAIDGVEVVGQDFESGLRAPTVSITMEMGRPEDLCAFLGNEGICAWDGHFYAIKAVEVLGLMERGGVTRFGISAYTQSYEIERVLEKVKDFSSNT